MMSIASLFQKRFEKTGQLGEAQMGNQILHWPVEVIFGRVGAHKDHSKWRTDQ